jgi:DNA modification methylase
MKDTRNISELREWDKNPRSIKRVDFERLKTQIKKLGQYKPLLITEDGEVIGGNMRLKAYRELGIKDVWVSVVKPKDENQKLEYALSDNDRAGYYDEDLLANLMPVYDIDWSQYAVDLKEPFNLKDLMDEFSGVIEDDPPAVDNGDPISKLGDVYQLGRHRLMCGDSTRIEDVEKLMDGKKADLFLTDPPYGVSYAEKNESLNAIAPANRIQTPIENDHMDKESMKVLWTTSFTNAFLSTTENAPYYINAMQGGDLVMMMMSIINGGWNLKHMMIWAKNNHVLGRMDYHYQHEPIFYGWKEGKSHNWYGDHSQTSLWQVDKPLKSDLHPTMKPIALCTKAIKNSSRQNEIVLDLFGGSGSTLIASEQTNRTCYMMEIDPKYCDVIRKRYAKFMGKEDEWQTITPLIKS